jgi:hypothetical protein
VACATVSPWEEFQATEQIPARILWDRGGEERVVTDAVFLQARPRDAGSSARAADGASPGAVALVVGKGHPLLELHWENGILQARGALVRRGWRGAIERAPVELADWGWLLQAWMAARAVPGEGNQEIHTGAFRAAWQREGRQLRGFQMQPNARPTRFTVQFLSTE